MKDNNDVRIFEKIMPFADLANKQVLEVGCGDGRITSLLAGKSEKRIAIEPDAGVVIPSRTKLIC